MRPASNNRLTILFCNNVVIVAAVILLSGLFIEKLSSQTYRSTPQKNAYKINNNNSPSQTESKSNAGFFKRMTRKFGNGQNQTKNYNEKSVKEIRTVKKPLIDKQKFKKFFKKKEKQNESLQLNQVPLQKTQQHQNTNQFKTQSQPHRQATHFKQTLPQQNITAKQMRIGNHPLNQNRNIKTPKLSIEYDHDEPGTSITNRNLPRYYSANRNAIPLHHNQNQFEYRKMLSPRTSQTVQTQYTLPLPEDVENSPTVLNNPNLIEVPFKSGPVNSNLRITSHQGKISLQVRDARISDVLGLIAQQNGLNIVASSDVSGTVTVSLTNIDLNEALSSILITNGYTWSRNNNIIMISRLSSDSKTSSMVQGKLVKVLPLNFVAASEVDRVVKGLLSPVGQSFISETSPLEKLKTREEIVIEDLPEYVTRIEQYIQQIDHPPRQVYIEAHVLQVKLKDECRHGINYNALVRLAGADITFRTVGFANPLASPAFFLGVNSTDLNALVEALQTSFNAKTLASPKVLVLNGQEARIQIGQQLGYLITTTTQTSTLQQVDFLDLGVVLRVTPQISNDNQILMSVKPEVSSGRINPISGLPEEDTTEVETTIMLSDNQGMIIGGLIKEEEVNELTQIPILGDLWVAGKLFQKRRLTRERNEVIIALVPRIVPYGSMNLPEDNIKLNQAQTKMFKDPLYNPPCEDDHHHPGYQLQDQNVHNQGIQGQHYQEQNNQEQHFEEQHIQNQLELNP